MRIILFLAFASFFSSINAQIKFPEDNFDKGYENSEVHARIAFPINGQSRIWIKGSAEKSIAKFKDASSSTFLKEVKLKSPFYTDIVTVNAESVIVSFCNDLNTCEDYAVLDTGYYNSVKSDNFSLLIYGCLEPFQVVYESGKPKAKIFEGDQNSSYKIRELFKGISMNEKIAYRDSVKLDYEYNYKGSFKEKLINTPKAILTTGDQVYVDAGYETKIEKGDVHPIAAWESKRRPKPFDTSAVNYISYLNKLYNASYSFSQIETAHQRLPLLPAIDDHELRDGWGSQGDEYKDGVINPELAQHFRLGKKAFIEHQLLSSNYPVNKAREQLSDFKTLDYPFVINGKNGYVFDLRSARNINGNILLGEEQWSNFESWLNGLERNQEIILVTSVPLTLRPLKLIEDIVKLFVPELRDDVRDGWNARNNRADRDRLLQLLTKHRIVNDIKPIFVSGDIHKSALIEIWMDPNVRRNGKHDVNETMILGYEVVSSGISHEFIKSGISKSIFKRTESQRLGDGFIEFDYNGYMASIYPMVRKSTVTQNFAAIEFSKSSNTKIHTFIYNQADETLEQHYIDLDFNKRMPNDDYFIYENPDDKANSKKNFEPPIPDGLRVILEASKEMR